ncbi:hypothetical protein DVH24_006387 [Malus domestica]|uniref:Uncharacterized protein n=1 Tax=Malus domestica TaxID=3750 RepID=A0A498K9Z3_MALDO|nr:hypothetical protein DVH24_006387 [Malus domestica]
MPKTNQGIVHQIDEGRELKNKTYMMMSREDREKSHKRNVKSPNIIWEEIKPKAKLTNHDEEKFVYACTLLGFTTVEKAEIMVSKAETIFIDSFFVARLVNKIQDTIHFLFISQVKLVIQKKIFAIDLNIHHDHLSMLENQIVDKKFLNEQHN